MSTTMKARKMMVEYRGSPGCILVMQLLPQGKLFVEKVQQEVYVPKRLPGSPTLSPISIESWVMGPGEERDELRGSFIRFHPKTVHDADNSFVLKSGKIYTTYDGFHAMNKEAAECHRMRRVLVRLGNVNTIEFLASLITKKIFVRNDDGEDIVSIRTDGDIETEIDTPSGPKMVAVTNATYLFTHLRDGVHDIRWIDIANRLVDPGILGCEVISEFLADTSTFSV